MLNSMHSGLFIKLWRAEIAVIYSLADGTNIFRTISLIFCMATEEHYLMENDDEQDLQNVLNEASTLLKAVLAIATDCEEIKCLNLMGRNLQRVVNDVCPYGINGGCGGTTKFNFP